MKIHSNIHLYLSVLLLCWIILSCTKDESAPDLKKRITGHWAFAEKPARLTNPWMGHIEDRTVFSGEEILGFQAQDEFYVSDSLYGSWSLDSMGNIGIDLSLKGGYAITDFKQNQMYFEIIEITDSSMRVAHNFYRFYGNTYLLKKIL
jgi:hypothetical protein